MTIAAALDELKRSPAIYDHLDHLQQMMGEEERRRQQFYNELDERGAAEFINGAIVTLPTVTTSHADTSSFIGSILDNFASSRGLGRVFVARCLVRCRRNDYRPDVCFFAATKVVGFSADQAIFPPPDLVVEVLAPMTEGNDRNLKKEDYARHGVGEYWIVDVEERMVEQYVLPPGGSRYDLKARLPDGARLNSVALPGLSARVAAFFEAGEPGQP